MSENRMNKISELLKNDENIDCLIAELRDEFLDVNTINELVGYGITSEIASCPSSVLFYIAIYIDHLEWRLEESE